MASLGLSPNEMLPANLWLPDCTLNNRLGSMAFDTHVKRGRLGDVKDTRLALPPDPSVSNAIYVQTNYDGRIYLPQPLLGNCL